MCELAKGGMFKVEYAGTLIDQKLNHAWNCSKIMVAYSVSIFQLKARVEIQKYRHKKLFAKVYKNVNVWYISMSVYFTKLSAFSKRNCVEPPIEDETNGLDQGGNGMVEQCICTPALQCRRKMRFSPVLQLLQHFKTKNCDKISL